MADALENAIRDTGRVPNLVLSGHVHNYQRIEQTIAEDGPTPFIVTGNGGYHNLHKLNVPGGSTDYRDPENGAVLKHGEDGCWGFLTLTIDGDGISGAATNVDRNGAVTTGDQFAAYSVAPIVLPQPKLVPTL
jgi:hypothetical protein